jgi:transposase
MTATVLGAFPFLTGFVPTAATAACAPSDKFCRGLKVEIVRWSEALVVLPKRSLVERTLAWLGRCRRLAKDWEARRSLRLASIRHMLQKTMQSHVMFPTDA